MLNPRTLARLGDRSQVWADLHRTAASKVVANPADHPEMIAWRQILGPGNLFVDVGANIASYAIWAGEIGVDAVALEPAEDTSSYFMEKIALNGCPVKGILAAGATAVLLGSRSGVTAWTVLILAAVGTACGVRIGLVAHAAQ